MSRTIKYVTTLIMITITLGDEVIAKQSCVGYAPLSHEVMAVATYLRRKRTTGFENYNFRLCPEDNCYYGNIRGSIKNLEHEVADISFFGVDIKDFDRLIRPLLEA